MNTQKLDQTTDASLLRKLVLTIALTTGALLASSTTAHAQQPSSPDPGVRCAAKVGPGQYEFYLPGERATDVNGNKWVCGPDGQWFRDYSALTTGPVVTIGPVFRAPTFVIPSTVATLVLR
jgi:hypothetical protein